MFAIKDDFSKMDNWRSEQLNTGVEDDVEGQLSWQELPDDLAVGMAFRFDVCFQLGEGTFGFKATVPSQSTELWSEQTVGFCFDAEGFKVCYSHLAGGSGNTLLLSASTLKKEDAYKAGIVSDGTTITFSLTDQNGKVLSIFKDKAPVIALSVVFFATYDLTMKRLAVLSSLDGYDDPLFDEPMRFYCYPGEKDEQARAYVECPASYKSGSPHRLIIYTHGAGGSPEDFINLWENETNLRQALVDAGYVFAVSHAYGDNWGNEKVIKVNMALYSYLQKKLHLLDKVYLMGQSMGGHGACLTAMAHPQICACIGLIFPSLNLDWQYYGLYSSYAFAESINAAYDCTTQNYQLKTYGHNTHQRLEELAKFPMKIWHGEADTVVGIRHAKALVEGIKALGGNAELVSFQGADHGDIVCYDPDGIIAFFKQI